MANFEVSILVAARPQLLFDTINKVSAWWSKDFSGKSREEGDEFTVQFGETWIRLKVIESDPGKKLVWLVADCYKHWLQDKQEWKNTQIVWEIFGEIEETKITLTHLGLVPELECYNVCEKAWDFYLKDSLYNLVTTGQGKPS